jgi:hypothetical protein
MFPLLPAVVSLFLLSGAPLLVTMSLCSAGNVSPRENLLDFIASRVQQDNGNWHAASLRVGSFKGDIHGQEALSDRR